MKTRSRRLQWLSFLLFLAMLSLCWQPLAPQVVNAEVSDNITPPVSINPEPSDNVTPPTPVDPEPTRMEPTLPPVTEETPANPKLDSMLNRLVELATGSSAASDVNLGAPEPSPFSMEIDVYDGNTVRVMIEALPGQQDLAVTAATNVGATVETTAGNLVQVVIPVTELTNLAANPAIKFIRLPYSPILETGTVNSEGVATILANAWQAEGITGAGVKIAVLDSGFTDYAARQAAGELPAGAIVQSFDTENGIDGTTSHGTGCAEIVYDVAPGATLYLVNFSTTAELSNAVDYLIAQGVDIISFSIGYTTAGRGDGTGPVCDIVDRAAAAGITWVKSAGNSAQRHWGGAFSDGNSNSYHEWSGSTEGNSFTLSAPAAVSISLRWDDPWGASANNFDLFLYDSGMNPISGAASTSVQDGDDYAVEYLSGVASAGTFNIVVQRLSGTAPVNLNLLVNFNGLSFTNPEGSLTIPGDSPNAITAGAFQFDTPTTIEPFSSQGPTVDGRIKPDVASPDGVSTVTYGTRGFYGTSAAAPHTAAAAALVLQRYPTYTPAQIQAFLEGRAVDVGAAGKDNVFGSGRLYLGSVPQFSLTTNSTTGGSVTTPGEGTFGYSPGAVVSLVATPDLGYTFTNWAGDVGTVASATAASTTITMSGNYSITANFTAMIPAAITDSQAIWANGSSVVLNWTAPGASGSNGTATAYDVRYATSTINDGNWAAATQASGEPTPLPAGSSTNCTVSGLSANTTYYFAVKTTATLSDWSPLSNVTACTTPPASINGTEWNVAVGYKYSDVFRGLDATSDGGYIAIGGTFLHSNWDTWLTKVTANGTEQWRQLWDQNTSTDWGTSVVQTSDGGYAVSSYFRKPSGTQDYEGQITKTDASGNVSWTRIFGGTADDRLREVIQTADGNLLVAGPIESAGAGGSDVWLIKLDASTTNTMWSQIIGGTGTDDLVNGLVQTADGGYVIAGYTNSSGLGGYDAWLVKTDASGGVSWNKTYGGTAHEIANSVVQTSDGGYLIVGDTAGSGNGDAWLVKTDASGVQQWAQTYGGSANDTAIQVAQTAQGDFIFVGQTASYGAGGADIWLVLTDSSGNQKSQLVLGGSNDENCYDMALNTDGSILIAGYSKTFGGSSVNSYYSGWLIKTLTPRVLTTASTTGGSVTVPGEGSSHYLADSMVNILATPDASHIFSHWSGDVSTVTNVNAANTIITMSDNYSITANFVGIPANLTLSSSSGGSVTTPGEGTFTYEKGTVASIVATPDAGYKFTHWSGDNTTIANPVAASTNITMSGNYSISANFLVMIPAAITDLAMVWANGNSAVLIWTAPGADNYTGTASVYDLRYSTSTYSDTWWANATQATTEPAPLPAGSTQNCTITGLAPNTTYYYAIQTASAAGVWSGMVSPHSSTTPPATINGTAWNVTLGTLGSDVIRDATATSDGGYIISGAAFWSGWDLWLSKVSGSGTEQQRQLLDAGNTDWGRAVIQTSDGGYAVGGYTKSYGAGGYDMWLLKLDASGGVSWNTTYGGVADDRLYHVVQTSDGGYLLAGETESYGNGNEDIWLVKTDASGSISWNKTYGGNGTDDMVHGIVQTSDGGYAIAGYTNSSGAGNNDAWLVKTDASGNQQWTQTYGGSANDSANALVQTSDGGYLLAGDTESSGAGNSDAWLIKTNSSGVQQWTQTYGGSANDTAIQVAQTAQGDFTFVGQTASYGAGGADIWLVLTDSSGNEKDQLVLGGANDENCYDMVLNTDGSIMIAGYTKSYGTSSYHPYYSGWLVQTLPLRVLTTTSTAGGSVTAPGEGSFSYLTGDVVPLVATPAAGYHFVNWTGDNGTIANPVAASTTITMNSNLSITANFANTPPVLSAGNVTPTSGYQATSFTYSVTYTDVENAAPSSILISIDGAAGVAMTAANGGDTDYTDGKVYTYTTSGLAKGAHTYQFSASDGTSSATGDVGSHDGPTVQNTPPTQPTVAVTPGTPYTTDDLVCTVTANSTDVDGDDIIYGYTWYMDNVLQPALTAATVPTANTTKGHGWKCVVTPSDGTDNGTPGISNQVTILNTLPTLSDVTISPDPAWDGSDLTAVPGTWTDADNDAAAYQYQWQKYNSGWSNVSGATGPNMGSVNTSAGDRFKVIVTPFDGEATGTPVSAEITIQAPPSVSITAPTNWSTTTAATVNVSGSANATPSVSEAVLELNGLPRAISVTNDAFNEAVTLLPGANFINVSITNLAGSANDSVTITRQTAPVVTLDTPLDGTVFGSATVNGSTTVNISVSGSVSANPMPASVSVSVNGSASSLNVDAASGLYTGNVTIAEGANTINATATNTAGSGSSATITVTLNSAAPRVTITSPTSGSATRQTTVNVSGSALDTPSLTSVTFEVNGVRQTVTLQNGSFNAAVNLIEGTNTINVIADDGTNQSSATITINRDTRAPAVAFTAPPYYYVTSQSSVTVEGYVDDTSVSQVTLTVNGANQTATVSGGAFSRSIALSNGANTIIASASDAAGNSGTSGTLVVIKDTSRPTVTVTQPKSGYVTGSTTLTVTGNVSSNNPLSSATLELNTVASTLTVTNGRFSKSVTLVPGENTIEVFAEDNASPPNVGTSGVISVTLDQSGPVVTLDYPREGMLLGSTAVTLRGTVDDPAVTSATLTLNGAASTITVNNGSFSVAGTLASGTNTILISASDAYGNRGTSGTTVVEVQTGKPTVTITTPRPDLVTGNATLPVSGTVSHTSTIDEATLRLNGSATTLTLNSGTPQTFGTSVTLTEGRNTIAVSATDGATPANTGASGVIYVTLDTTAPVISVTAPASGSITSQTSVNVTGTIDDPAVTQATLTLNGASQTIPVQAQRFNHSVSLTSGSNTIRVAARDAAGNTGTSSTITLTMDASVPLVRITSPAGDSRTKTANIAVSGTAVDTPALSQATLTLNGAGQTISVSGNAFSQNVTLATGTNTIAVSASDGVNTGNSGSISVVLDSTAPTLTLELSDPTDSVKVTVSTNEALQSAPTVTVNGSAALGMTPIGINQWSGSYTIPAAGSYTVTASGTDRAGNTGTRTATFAKRTINLTANVSQAVTTSDTTVNITANSTLPGQSLTVTRHVANPASSASGSNMDAGLFVKILASPNLRDNLSSVYIRVDYDEADITARGIDESSLRLYLWDVSSGSWQQVAGSGVDTVNNFIYGTVDHLSEYGSFGSAPTTPTTTTPPSAGGGGGGGGGSTTTAPPPPGSTVLTGLVKDNGAFKQTVIARADDDACLLSVPKDVVGIDANGVALSYLSLLQAGTEGLTPTASGSILSAYDAGPAGTVFMPPVTLSISYPGGQTPGSGDYIAWWNGTEWVKLPSAVNSDNATASASVSHFTRFALISQGGTTSTTPAELTLSDISASPTNPEPNQIVTVQVKVSNPAATTTTGTLTLKLDGETLVTTDITLAAGDSRTLTFTLARPDPGEYNISVNNLNTKITVKAK